MITSDDLCHYSLLYSIILNYFYMDITGFELLLVLFRLEMMFIVSI